MTSTRLSCSAAALAAVTGLGFGIPGIYGLNHFAGFPTYGEGPFESIGLETSTPLLAGFVVVCVAEVGLAAAQWCRAPKSIQTSPVCTNRPSSAIHCSRLSWPTGGALLCPSASSSGSAAQRCC
mgnify:CR=1 FL=1|jgi:hypothetical protein